MGAATNEGRVPVPRDRDDDFTAEAAAARRDFVAEQTGARLDHVGSFSIDPAAVQGNCELFTGVAQVPLGFAGPLLVDGEHAKGTYYVPLATSEGTLVASYNRGMAVIHASGGARTTVLNDRMQRAPSFEFSSARGARALSGFLDDNFEQIKEAAATTTSTGVLQDIDRWVVGRRLYTRFNYTTGDAAGQNMTGKATLAACEWIVPQLEGLVGWILDSNTATDKKTSAVNSLYTRGKRVVAEVTIPRDVCTDMLRTTPEEMFHARMASLHGGLLSGMVTNGTHPANGLTALFIATGQDVANVVESSNTLNYVEVTEDGDYYYSSTLQSLIVATFGGGTALPTQHECLTALDCVGRGTVFRFAEICAATVLAGEISLGAAVVAGDWVSSHEEHGRNR